MYRQNPVTKKRPAWDRLMSIMAIHIVQRRRLYIQPPGGEGLFCWPRLALGIIKWLHPQIETFHDDVIKWKHFPRHWPFVRGIHRSPVNSTHKGQWRGALMFSLIRDLIHGWVNNREAGDLRRHQAHYDVIVMQARLAYSTLCCTVCEQMILANGYKATMQNIH